VRFSAAPKSREHLFTLPDFADLFEVSEPERDGNQQFLRSRHEGVVPGLAQMGQ